MTNAQNMPDPQATAEAVAATMYAQDRASQWLGMKVDEVRPGYARLRMQVREEMLNGLRMCHGGIIFTLADSAFAFACNSHNVITVAAACQVDFLKPGRPGDWLVAEAVERVLGRGSGVYDVSVVNQDGETVALFRGKSHRLKGEVAGALHAAAGQAGS
ncbi:MAG: hydroxyphenylacetyl-CoA thioesterase PaaI [Nevskia sp.]|nr:hydroxyphenylacetyl-CoA thioesterase PaaI [Nevskia sp.]